MQMLALVMVFPAIPWLLAGGCSVSEMDALYIILDKLVFPSKYDRSNTFLVTKSLLIFVFYLLTFIDLSRFFCLISFCGLTFARRLDVITKGMTRKWKDSENPVPVYNSVYILVACVLRRFLDDILYRILFTVFWLAVTSSWVVITQEASIVTYPIYLCLISGSLVICLFSYAIMHKVSSIQDSTFCHLSLQTFVGKYRLSMAASKQKRIKCLTIKALRPIRLHYGSFDVVDHKFIRAYGWNLLERIFDAILMQAN